MAPKAADNAVELDTRNKAPVFDLDEDGDRDAMVTRKVEENTEANAADDSMTDATDDNDNVGAAVTAIDAKADGSAETLTYSLGGDDAAKFPGAAGRRRHHQRERRRPDRGCGGDEAELRDQVHLHGDGHGQGPPGRFRIHTRDHLGHRRG